MATLLPSLERFACGSRSNTLTPSSDSFPFFVALIACLPRASTLIDIGNFGTEYLQITGKIPKQQICDRTAPSRRNQSGVVSFMRCPQSHSISTQFTRLFFLAKTRTRRTRSTFPEPWRPDSPHLHCLGVSVTFPSDDSSVELMVWVDRPGYRS
ncbi:hypothetical protein FB451DRAFT_291635 [Mycena latifolia]|nr:hypothetical protein FB451DRAFT_291635 [Mycena latifolia]